jgi:hypothetical protein
MIQEDSPICHTSEQVESEISAFRRERSENLHRYPTLRWDGRLLI